LADAIPDEEALADAIPDEEALADAIPDEEALADAIPDEEVLIAQVGQVHPGLALVLGNFPPEQQQQILTAIREHGYNRFNEQEKIAFAKATPREREAMIMKKVSCSDINKEARKIKNKLKKMGKKVKTRDIRKIMIIGIVSDISDRSNLKGNDKIDKKRMLKQINKKFEGNSRKLLGKKVAASAVNTAASVMKVDKEKDSASNLASNAIGVAQNKVMSLLELEVKSIAMSIASRLTSKAESMVASPHAQVALQVVKSLKNASSTEDISKSMDLKEAIVGAITGDYKRFIGIGVTLAILLAISITLIPGVLSGDTEESNSYNNYNYVEKNCEGEEDDEDPEMEDIEDITLTEEEEAELSKPSISKLQVDNINMVYNAFDKYFYGIKTEAVSPVYCSDGSLEESINSLGLVRDKESFSVGNINKMNTMSTLVNDIVRKLSVQKIKTFNLFKTINNVENDTTNEFLKFFLEEITEDSFKSSLRSNLTDVTIDNPSITDFISILNEYKTAMVEIKSKESIINRFKDNYTENTQVVFSENPEIKYSIYTSQIIEYLYDSQSSSIFSSLKNMILADFPESSLSDQQIKNSLSSYLTAMNNEKTRTKHIGIFKSNYANKNTVNLNCYEHIAGKNTLLDFNKRFVSFAVPKRQRVDILGSYLNNNVSEKIFEKCFLGGLTKTNVKDIILRDFQGSNYVLSLEYMDFEDTFDGYMEEMTNIKIKRELIPRFKSQHLVTSDENYVRNLNYKISLTPREFNRTKDFYIKTENSINKSFLDILKNSDSVVGSAIMTGQILNNYNSLSLSSLTNNYIKETLLSNDAYLSNLFDLHLDNQNQLIKYLIGELWFSEFISSVQKNIENYEKIIVTLPYLRAVDRLKLELLDIEEELKESYGEYSRILSIISNAESEIEKNKNQPSNQNYVRQQQEIIDNNSLLLVDAKEDYDNINNIYKEKKDEIIKLKAKIASINFTVNISSQSKTSLESDLESRRTYMIETALPNAVNDYMTPTSNYRIQHPDAITRLDLDYKIMKFPEPARSTQTYDIYGKLTLSDNTTIINNSVVYEEDEFKEITNDHASSNMFVEYFKNKISFEKIRDQLRKNLPNNGQLDLYSESNFYSQLKIIKNQINNLAFEKLVSGLGDTNISTSYVLKIIPDDVFLFPAESYNIVRDEDFQDIFMKFYIGEIKDEDLFNELLRSKTSETMSANTVQIKNNLEETQATNLATTQIKKIYIDSKSERDLSTDLSNLKIEMDELKKRLKADPPEYSELLPEIVNQCYSDFETKFNQNPLKSGQDSEPFCYEELIYHTQVDPGEENFDQSQLEKAKWENFKNLISLIYFVSNIDDAPEYFTSDLTDSSLYDFLESLNDEMTSITADLIFRVGSDSSDKPEMRFVYGSDKNKTKYFLANKLIETYEQFYIKNISDMRDFISQINSEISLLNNYLSSAPYNYEIDFKNDDERAYVVQEFIENSIKMENSMRMFDDRGVRLLDVEVERLIELEQKNTSDMTNEEINELSSLTSRNSDFTPVHNSSNLKTAYDDILAMINNISNKEKIMIDKKKELEIIDLVNSSRNYFRDLKEVCDDNVGSDVELIDQTISFINDFNYQATISIPTNDTQRENLRKKLEEALNSFEILGKLIDDYFIINPITSEESMTEEQRIVRILKLSIADVKIPIAQLINYDQKYYNDNPIKLSLLSFPRLYENYFQKLNSINPLALDIDNKTNLNNRFTNAKSELKKIFDFAYDVLEEKYNEITNLISNDLDDLNTLSIINNSINLNFGQIRDPIISSINKTAEEIRKIAGKEEINLGTLGENESDEFTAIYETYDRIKTFNIDQILSLPLLDRSIIEAKISNIKTLIDYRDKTPEELTEDMQAALPILENIVASISAARIESYAKKPSISTDINSKIDKTQFYDTETGTMISRNLIEIKNNSDFADIIDKAEQLLNPTLDSEAYTQEPVGNKTSINSSEDYATKVFELIISTTGMYVKDGLIVIPENYVIEKINIDYSFDDFETWFERSEFFKEYIDGSGFSSYEFLEYFRGYQQVFLPSNQSLFPVLNQKWEDKISRSYGYKRKFKDGIRKMPYISPTTTASPTMPSISDNSESSVDNWIPSIPSISPELRRYLSENNAVSIRFNNNEIRNIYPISSGIVINVTNDSVSVLCIDNESFEPDAEIDTPLFDKFLICEYKNITPGYITKTIDKSSSTPIWTNVDRNTLSVGDVVMRYPVPKREYYEISADADELQISALEESIKNYTPSIAIGKSIPNTDLIIKTSFYRTEYDKTEFRYYSNAIIALERLKKALDLDDGNNSNLNENAKKSYALISKYLFRSVYEMAESYNPPSDIWYWWHHNSWWNSSTTAEVVLPRKLTANICEYAASLSSNIAKMYTYNSRDNTIKSAAQRSTDDYTTAKRLNSYINFDFVNNRFQYYYGYGYECLGNLSRIAGYSQSAKVSAKNAINANDYPEISRMRYYVCKCFYDYLKAATNYYYYKNTDIYRGNPSNFEFETALTATNSLIGSSGTINLNEIRNTNDGNSIYYRFFSILSYMFQRITGNMFNENLISANCLEATNPLLLIESNQDLPMFEYDPTLIPFPQPRQSESPSPSSQNAFYDPAAPNDPVLTPFVPNDRVLHAELLNIAGEIMRYVGLICCIWSVIRFSMGLSNYESADYQHIWQFVAGTILTFGGMLLRAIANLRV
ncbi:MAG: hypothetical protein LBJ93_02750, partial [Clostridiales bacterium]|nr:hypothetical protein [Clostridiales bacterium]